MYVVHIALGGCLKSPPVSYGVTEDTGGHIAYVLGAASAQARRPEVSRVDVVTRLFHDTSLDPCHGSPLERLGPKLRIVRVPTGNRRYLAKADLAAEVASFARALIGFLARQGRAPDLVHAHFQDAAEVALAVRERFGSPFFYSAHSLALDKAEDGGLCAGDPTLRARIEGEELAIRAADRVVASSRDEAVRQLARYRAHDPRKVIAVAPGIDRPLPGSAGHDTGEARKLVAPWLREPDRPMILTIARPVARKNLTGLVDCYGRNAALRARANLVVLAGLHDDPGRLPVESRRELAELKRAVKTHDLDGRVALPPWHQRHHVFGLYALAALGGGVFVNPAVIEPYGLSVAEAAAAGLPVVASRRGGAGDIIAELGCGIAVDTGDDRALAAAVERLLTDDTLHARFGATGRRRARSRGWAVWAARISEAHGALVRGAVWAAGPPVVGRRSGASPGEVTAAL